MQIKTIAKRWLPPALIERLKPLLGIGIYFSDNYTDWGTASAHASGYDSVLILEQVEQAMLKVKAGEAAFERDSVLFDEVQHSFPVLAGLLRAALENGNQLSVLDFGGSLGSSYFQCREFLSVLPSLKWGVVEQEHFVHCGQRIFEAAQLRFFCTIAECLQQATPNVALLSSVLQYLPKPYHVLDELMNSRVPYIIIDRTPFGDQETDFITVQRVPPSIYVASYPCWVFGKQSFLDKFRARYKVIAQFNSGDGNAIAKGREFTFGGMILRQV
jgi:putative methyltransferase (TIGR04325 family)